MGFDKTAATDIFKNAKDNFLQTRYTSDCRSVFKVFSEQVVPCNLAVYTRWAMFLPTVDLKL